MSKLVKKWNSLLQDHPIPSIKNDDIESSLEHNHLTDLLQLGHVFALVAPQGNDEKYDYWLARFVRGKQKLAQPITDDDGFTYPTGLVVVARTWLCDIHAQKERNSYI